VDPNYNSRDENATGPACTPGDVAWKWVLDNPPEIPHIEQRRGIIGHFIGYLSSDLAFH
jgi:hypothetical protein